MTGIVLAGGKSRRIGSNKALLPFEGRPLILRAVEALESVAEKVWVITDSSEVYSSFGFSVRTDVLPTHGCLGGIYTGLMAAETPYSLVLACDMPFARPEFLNFLTVQMAGFDVVIPKGTKGYEPLCAVYSKACLKPILSQLEAGQFKVTDFLERVRVRVVEPAEIEPFDPDGRMFTNINTLAQYHEAVKGR
ncbi:MAG: molybdenum cofactor guanylyltransferase [Candidatus Latescibacterota bacterium]